MPPQALGGRDFNAGQQRLSEIRYETVQLSIGLEDADDLIEDIDQA